MRILFTVLLLVTFSGAQATDSRVWQVQFGVQGNTPLSVSRNGDVIEFRNEKGVVFTIPIGSITTIFHAHQELRRSTQAFNLFEEICCGGTNSHLLSVLAFLVAAPLGSSKSEYVEIDWTSKGSGNVQLRLPPDEYAPFMDWVSRLSGVEPRDLEQERQEAVRLIEQRANETFSVTELDSDAEEFEVLPVESNGNTFLYFFRRPVTPKNLVFIMPVTEEPADNWCVRGTWGKIVRGPCRGDRCEIRAILLPRYTYRPGTLPRTYTVDADGLLPSECRVLGVQRRNPLSDKPTLRRK